MQSVRVFAEPERCFPHETRNEGGLGLGGGRRSMGESRRRKRKKERANIIVSVSAEVVGLMLDPDFFVGIGQTGSKFISCKN